jgi:pimeloyl-ACP methyl ester carboxylesterase
MGVRSACALAQLRPDWVEGLILIDLGLSGPAGGGLGENLSRLIRVLPERFESRAAARAFLEASSPDLSIARYLLAVLAPAPEGDGGVVFPFDAGALLATIEGARDVPVRHWVQAAAERGTPALLLRGAESQVWSKEDFEAEKAEFARWPHVQFVEFSGTGHGLPFEKRSQLKQAVQAITTHPHDPLPAH